MVTTGSYRQVVEEYMEGSEFDVFENANKYPSPTGMLTYVAERALETLIPKELPRRVLKLHRLGDIYVHKLPYSLFIPYCSGHSVRRLLLKGLKTPTIVARPAKHLDTYVDHVANYLTSMQHFFSGAQAFSSVELYAGAFIRRDGVWYERLKQQVQRLVYNLNFPSRAGTQTPFTNFTVVLDAPKRMLVEEKAVVGGREDGELGAYLEEAKLFLKALAEVLAEGDAAGRPFTFPIPTLMVTAKSLWDDPEIHEVVFRVASRKGSFYWLNTRLVDPDASFSMCCRINIDRRELMHAMNGGFRLARKDLEEVREGWLRSYERQRSGGLWAMPDITGSVGVITVNLPRLALKACGEDSKFFEGLDEVLEVVREGLTWFRRRYCRLAREYPHVYSMPLEYLPEVFQLLGGPYFNTIGLIGLPEAAAIMLRDPKLWLDGSRSSRLRAAEWMRSVVQYVVRRAREWSIESGMPFNVEEVPGESASPKLASRDLREFPELAEYLPSTDEPIYSTSIAPYYADLPLSERVEIEEAVQKYFTGGVMMHIFLGEEADPEALASLTRKLMQTDLLYWSYTPAVSVCPKCGWSVTGIVTECPKCGSETEVWSRIIGYYRPLKNWNPARRKEFWLRKHYRLF